MISKEEIQLPGQQLTLSYVNGSFVVRALSSKITALQRTGGSVGTMASSPRASEYLGTAARA